MLYFIIYHLHFISQTEERPNNLHYNLILLSVGAMLVPFQCSQVQTQHSTVASVDLNNLRLRLTWARCVQIQNYQKEKYRIWKISLSGISTKYIIFTKKIKFNPCIELVILSGFMFHVNCIRFTSFLRWPRFWHWY